MTTPNENVSIIDQLLDRAYNHPKFSKYILNYHTVCPSCHCELVQVVQDMFGERTLWCAFCYLTFKERRTLLVA